MFSYVKGMSDLFSEDDGKTWGNLSDFYAEIPGMELEGYASWFITGNITDTDRAETVEQNVNQYAYEIYRNGEKLTNSFIHPLSSGYKAQGHLWPGGRFSTLEEIPG